MSVKDFWMFLKREAAFGRISYDEAEEYLWSLNDKGWYEKGWIQ